MNRIIYSILLYSFLFFACKKDGNENNYTQRLATWEVQAGTLGNGVNLQPSYYHSGDVDLGWSLMEAYPKITTVRIEIEPFMNIETVKRWISEASANGYTIICTYHHYPHNVSTNVQTLVQGAQWWKQNYAALRSAGIFYVNLMNEWGGLSTTTEEYTKAYNQAIPILREVYNGPIIIDVCLAGSKTDVTVDAVNGKNGNKIQDDFIILSTHIYGYSVQLKEDLDKMKGTGKKCIVGEFGRTPGSQNWSSLVKYAKDQGWPIIGWAWNGDGDDLNMIGPQFSPAPATYVVSPYFDVIYELL